MVWLSSCGGVVEITLSGTPAGTVGEVSIGAVERVTNVSGVSVPLADGAVWAGVSPVIIKKPTLSAMNSTHRMIIIILPFLDFMRQPPISARRGGLRGIFLICVL